MTTKYLLLILFICLTISNIWGQTTNPNTVSLAHDQSAKLEEFRTTKQSLFKVKLYSIDKPIINKKHHWFLQIFDKNNQEVNYGKVELNAYLKTDPTIKLNYVAPVFAMCNQGKYIIGFVRVKQAGIWVLDITVHQGNTKDFISMEMSVDNVLN